LYTNRENNFLSRAFPEHNVGDKDNVDCDVEAQICLVIGNLPITDSKLCKIVEMSKTDSEMQNLKNFVVHGWPKDIKRVPENIKKYWNYRDEICECKGILLKNDRLIIPNGLRQEMLEKIHYNHLGIENAKAGHEIVSFGQT
jgi:hypothetical protein